MGNPVGQRVEAAYANVLSGVPVSGFGLPGNFINIYTSLSNVTEVAPSIEIISDEATLEAYNLGVFHVPLSIYVKDMAADRNINNFSPLAETLYEACMSDTIASQLMTAQTDLAVYDVRFVGLNNTTAQDAWVYSLSVEVICALKS